MKLILTQPELEAAIRQHINQLFTLKGDVDIEIDWKAGRGDNGMSAEIDINYMDVRSLPEAAPKTVAEPEVVTDTPAEEPRQKRPYNKRPKLAFTGDAESEEASEGDPDEVVSQAAEDVPLQEPDEAEQEKEPAKEPEPENKTSRKSLFNN